MGGAAADVSVPVLSAEVPAGHGTATALPPATDPPRTVDGATGDWRGRPSGFGGSTIYSSGELVYQDHIFDAYGPDNGQDKQRLAARDGVQPPFPEASRLHPRVPVPARRVRDPDARLQPRDPLRPPRAPGRGGPLRAPRRRRRGQPLGP